MNRRQFFDEVAVEWDASKTEETHTRLREIVAGLGIESESTVLDVGAGTGVLAPLLLEATDGEGQVVALDFSGEMLRRAQAKGHPVAYVQGDAQRLPFLAETFDWVICSAVFPHFPDKRRALSEASRVLREGGRLVICHTASRQTINEFHHHLQNSIGRRGEHEVVKLGRKRAGRVAKGANRHASAAKAGELTIMYGVYVDTINVHLDARPLPYYP